MQLEKVTEYIRSQPVLKRLYRNAGILFGGNVISAFIGLLTLVIVTRSLTLETFGHYALITSFVGLIDRLTSFQTWQALIHFGAKAKEQNDKTLLASLFAFGWVLDTLSGLVGFAIAIAVALYIPSWFGLASEHNDYFFVTVIAATVLIFNWSSTPTAVLRLYDKFYAQALYQKVMASIIFMGSLLLWLLGSNDIFHFATVWAVGTIFGRMLFLCMAIKEAKSQEVWALSNVDFKHLFSQTEGLWKYVVTTNLDGIVRVVRDVDIFIVNAVLGASMSGLYKIARRMAQIAGKFTGPFYQAIYPELAKLHSENKTDEFLKLMKQASLTLGAVVSFLLFGFITTGWFLLPFVFGQEYAGAYVTAIFCVASMTIWGFAQPLSPAMMALGNVQLILKVHIYTTLFYIALLYLLVNIFGLVGAGGALLIFYAVWSLSMYIAFKRIVFYTPPQNISPQ